MLGQVHHKAFIPSQRDGRQRRRVSCTTVWIHFKWTMTASRFGGYCSILRQPVGPTVRWCDRSLVLRLGLDDFDSGEVGSSQMASTLVKTGRMGLCGSRLG